MNGPYSCYCCGDSGYNHIPKLILPMRQAHFNTEVDKGYLLCVRCVQDVANVAYDYMQELRKRNGLEKENE